MAWKLLIKITKLIIIYWHFNNEIVVDIMKRAAAVNGATNNLFPTSIQQNGTESQAYRTLIKIYFPFSSIFFINAIIHRKWKKRR